MKLLALDAATEACSAALLQDGELSERYEVIGRGHAGRLLPMADELLKEARISTADLDAIAFGRGPGGFTGLRIAAGIAQGLAAGSRRRVLPVSNLAAVAAGAARSNGVSRVLVCMDARMGQVYWAAFDCSGRQPVTETEERLSNPADVTPPGGKSWFGAGHGFANYPELGARLASQLNGVDAAILPRASEIARIAACDLAEGKAVDATRALPVYLRNDVVHRR
ncbi:MAG TPA: tRNA (adenosine(37)-N6)-threonylcarbamoyltransferase complex dimerization subunit type 1 TsaB [Steroidobacteraceae bacterium]